MKVVVIGGGIVGITTAYALIKRGHEVCLIERNDTLGLETSFANGGQLSYRYVSPLADSGVPWQAVAWMMQRDSPLRFSPQWSIDQWKWCLDFLKACRTSINQRNTAHLLRLSLHSQTVLDTWRNEDSLGDFDWRANGKLVIYRRKDTFRKASAGPSSDVRQVLTPQQCGEIEPALAAIQDQLAGGIFAKGDEVADCYLFCQRLLERLKRQSGFSIMLSARVDEIQTDGSRVTGVVVNGPPINADHYVLAAGISSQKLVRPLGVKLPIYPLKGYSLTADLDPDAIAPETNVTDYDRKIVFARLGTRLRIAAMVDIAGSDTQIPRRRIEAIRRMAEQTFPRVANYTTATEWAGCRPATPQGTPILGTCGFSNLWLNVGHGSLGFTLACGSADAISDRISGTEPELSLEGLTLTT